MSKHPDKGECFSELPGPSAQHPTGFAGTGAAGLVGGVCHSIRLLLSQTLSWLVLCLPFSRFFPREKLPESHYSWPFLSHPDSSRGNFRKGENCHANQCSLFEPMFSWNSEDMARMRPRNKALNSFCSHGHRPRTKLRRDGVSCRYCVGCVSYFRGIVKPSSKEGKTVHLLSHPLNFKTHIHSFILSNLVADLEHSSWLRVTGGCQAGDELTELPSCLCFMGSPWTLTMTVRVNSESAFWGCASIHSLTTSGSLWKLTAPLNLCAAGNGPFQIQPLLVSIT